MDYDSITYDIWSSISFNSCILFIHILGNNLPMVQQD